MNTHRTYSERVSQRGLANILRQTHTTGKGRDRSTRRGDCAAINRFKKKNSESTMLISTFLKYKKNNQNPALKEEMTGTQRKISNN